MLTRLIIFLIRMRLGLKHRERFRFENQRSYNDYYFFEQDCLMKMEFVRPDPFHPHGRKLRRSGVSINWLLDKNCKIVRMNSFVK